MRLATIGRVALAAFAAAFLAGFCAGLIGAVAGNAVLGAALGLPAMVVAAHVIGRRLGRRRNAPNAAELIAGLGLYAVISLLLAFGLHEPHVVIFTLASAGTNGFVLSRAAMAARPGHPAGESRRTA